jgi:tetratricopeptide (TPR) repeat protein
VLDLELLGRWDEAVARVEEAEAVTAGSYPELAQLPVISIHCARGDLERGRAELERLAAIRESDDPQGISAYGAFEARLLRAEGKPVDALAAAERALGVRPQVGFTFWATRAALVEALEGAFALGAEDKIRDHLDTIESIQAGVLSPFLEAQRARFRARFAGADDPQAEAEFTTAEDGFRALGTPFWLAVTLVEHAELLLGQGRRDQAEPLLAEARDTFERLEAKPWLERLTAAEAGMPAKIPA